MAATDNVRQALLFPVTVRLAGCRWIGRATGIESAYRDPIASQIIETLDDEQAWTRSFQEEPEKLRRLAREAIEEHRRGETQRRR
jgi:hypothetical protein